MPQAPDWCFILKLILNAMNEKSAEFLSEYLETPAPTGLEMDAQRLWAEYIKPYTDEVQCDAYGSTWAVLPVRRSASEAAPLLPWIFMFFFGFFPFFQAFINSKIAAVNVTSDSYTQNA